MRPAATRAVVLASTLFTSATLFAQGLYWESTTTGGPRIGLAGVDAPREGKTFAAPKKLKMVQGERVVILRLDKEAFYTLNPKDKTYSEMTFAELDAVMKEVTDRLGGSEQLKKQAEELQKQLRDLPPEQRAAVEKALGQNPLLKGGAAAKEGKVEVAATGEKREIAGRSCVKQVATEDGKEILTAWTTKDFKEFAPLKADFAAAMKRLTSANSMVPGAKGAFTAYEKLDGFPLETVTASGLKTTVTKVEPRSIPDSEFDVPADYTKTESPLLKARAAFKGKPGAPVPNPKLDPKGGAPKE